MGFFSFIQEIAMDLGTANTIIISDDKIVVDEPSVVALDRRTDKMIAVGEKAKMMYEKTHDNIRTIRPLRDGVIADFTACEQMMRGLIKMVHTGSRLFSPCLPMGRRRRDSRSAIAAGRALKAGVTLSSKRRRIRQRISSSRA